MIYALGLLKYWFQQCLYIVEPNYPGPKEAPNKLRIDLNSASLDPFWGVGRCMAGGSVGPYDYSLTLAPGALRPQGLARLSRNSLTNGSQSFDDLK